MEYLNNNGWALLALENGDIRGGKVCEINTENGHTFYRLELTTHTNNNNITDYELLDVQQIKGIKFSSESEIDMIYSKNKNEHEDYKYPVLSF